MPWEGSRHRLLCLEFSGSKQRGTCTNASPSECSDAVGQSPEEKTATIEVSGGRNEATCTLSPFPTSRPQQSFSLESMTLINYLRVSYMHMVIFSSPSFFFSSSPHPHPPFPLPTSCLYYFLSNPLGPVLLPTCVGVWCHPLNLADCQGPQLLKKTLLP